MVGRSSSNMPRPVVALACGSRSTTRVAIPRAVAAPARPRAMVVLPTPPFWFTTATTGTSATLSGARLARNGPSPVRRPQRHAPRPQGLVALQEIGATSSTVPDRARLRHRSDDRGAARSDDAEVAIMTRGPLEGYGVLVTGGGTGIGGRAPRARGRRCRGDDLRPHRGQARSTRPGASPRSPPAGIGAPRGRRRHRRGRASEAAMAAATEATGDARRGGRERRWRRRAWGRTTCKTPTSSSACCTSTCSARCSA